MPSALRGTVWWPLPVACHGLLRSPATHPLLSGTSRPWSRERSAHPLSSRPGPVPGPTISPYGSWWHGWRTRTAKWSSSRSVMLGASATHFCANTEIFLRDDVVGVTRLGNSFRYGFQSTKEPEESNYLERHADSV